MAELAPPVQAGPDQAPVATAVAEPIVAALPAQGARPSVSYRQAGDGYLLLEYGDNVLDLALRMRIHLLMEALNADPIGGVQELSPGVRSLQIRYDSRVILQGELIERLLRIEAGLADVATLKVPTRVVYLPMAFEDSATLGAVQPPPAASIHAEPTCHTPSSPRSAARMAVACSMRMRTASSASRSLPG